MTRPHMEKESATPDPLLMSEPVETREILDEHSIRKMIVIERKRAERSNEHFLLMLLEAGNLPGSQKSKVALDGLVSALLSGTRETDVVGWYKDHTTACALFTGLDPKDKSTIVSTLLTRVSTTLQEQLSSDLYSQVSISLHFYPDDWEQDDSGRPSNPILYPDLFVPTNGKRPHLVLKRLMDVTGSAAILFLLAPVLVAIALAIKLTSKGPVIFRQHRVGQYGKPFAFLKFRSMRVGNDNSEHKEYVTKLIANQAQAQCSDKSGVGVYKLTNDKRITPIGQFLRRSSLDELPQLLNVLLGDMSLVGPRPPIPYEVAAYQTWHRRRVLEAKPGITGLWQVTGRSRVTFDEMVRLDLRYATTWSPLLDLKILLRTPFAVLKGAF